MGLRGARARPKGPPPKFRKPPWNNPGLTRVERVVRFLEYLPVTKGIRAGKKMRLLPGQRKFVDALYGQTPRKIRIAIKSEPRANGKTGLLAGLALAHLLGPESEPRGEIYSAAIDKMQAGLVFREMVAIIEAVPQFTARVNVQRFHKIIEVMSGDGAGSIYESLSADVRRAHGLAPSFWIFDELAQAKTSELLDNLITAMGKRDEPLGVIISTQAPDDRHPLSQLIDDGLQGIDPSIYVQLTAAPEDADPFDEETWKGCNEAWGKFLNVEEFRDEARRAERLPSFRAKFFNLRLNQRVDADVRYISDADWMACAGLIDPEALRGRPCIGGLDLSQTTALSSLVLYFPEDDGALLPFFWLPGDGLADRVREERVPYKLWLDQGLLETTPGRAIDYRAIVLRLAEVLADFDVKAIAYDRAFIKQLQTLCAEMGVEAPLVEYGQGYVSMSGAVQALEAAVLDQRIRHGGHPVLRWNVANASIDMDPAGNRKVTKKRSRGYVDGLIAALMAIGQAGKQEPPKIYEYSGPVVLRM